MSSSSLLRAAAIGLAIVAVAPSTAPAAGGHAPSTTFQQGAPPSRATIPPPEIRQAMARKLRAAGRPREAGRALRARTPVARAAWSADGRSFWIRTPTTGTCYWTLSAGGAVRKEITVAPPYVYAVDESPQVVYYRPYAYNADNVSQVYPLAAQQRLATFAAPATFGNVPATFDVAASPTSFGSVPLSIGMDVWWWSSARQTWISGHAWALPMWTARRLGSGVLSDQATSWRC